LATPSLAKAENYFESAYVGFTNPPPPGTVGELFGFGGGVGGPGFNFGFAGGIARYNILESAGFLGLAGESFSFPMLQNELGAPIGAFFGRRWQYDWRVFGVEAYLHSSTVNHEWTLNPGTNFDNTRFRLKTHWVGTVTATAGVAFDRLLLFTQAGVAMSHYVLDVDSDNLPRVSPAQARLGVAVGAGAEFAVTRRVSLGIGYRAYVLAPYRVTAGSEDLIVQVAAHSVTARLIYRFGTSERLQNWTEPFNWGGLYVGNYLGVLWQLGGTVGYDWTFGNNNLAGVSFRGGVALCCGLSYDFEASARVGRLMGDNVLVYAKVTAATQTGTFFGVATGPYYSAGVGVEVVLTPRVTGFTEWRAIGAPGLGFGDGYITAGFNFHFGQRR
jgi:opacity protein-like surface antigen